MVVGLFPARIKESYLLHSGDPRGVSELVSRMTTELMLDFEVFPVADPAELSHHIESKCLPAVLGGQARNDVESWISLQVNNILNVFFICVHPLC